MCPVPFPDNAVLSYNARDFANYLTCHRRRADGWQGLEEVAPMLGLGAGTGDSKTHLHAWLTKNYPSVSSPGHGQLFPPLTVEALCGHERFPDLFSAMFGESVQFAVFCLFNEAVRARVLAGMLAR